jgi:NADH:ubiquinone oxidoreductase subunit F (NADH-binding)
MKCIIWDLASVQLEIVLFLVQDSCMVCAQCTIGSEIVVEVPDGTNRRRGSSESSVRSVWR